MPLQDQTGSMHAHRADPYPDSDSDSDADAVAIVIRLGGGGAATFGIRSGSIAAGGRWW